MFLFLNFKNNKYNKFNLINLLIKDLYITTFELNNIK